jgi:hypothetical protein
MQCTYAVSLTTKRWTNETRGACVGDVTTWLKQHFPADRLPANIRIRLRPSNNDDAHRVEIIDSRTNGPTNSILVTVAPHKGQLVIEVRMRHLPLAGGIIPPLPAQLPPRAVTDLLMHFASTLEIYDAERRIDGTVTLVCTELDGQALAADFRDALARRLPIIVECTIDKSIENTITGAMARELVGIARVAHITTDEALHAFNDYCAAAVLDRNFVTTLWPRPENPVTIYTSQPTRDQIVQPILIAAAAQPELPIQSAFLIPAPTPIATNSSDTVTQLQRQLAEQREHIDQLDEELEDIELERDELAETVEARDDEIVMLRSNLKEAAIQVTNLDMELAQVAPERVLRSVLDALNRARKECTNLVFAREAFSTANDLQGPNPRTVFSILKKLDAAVARWRSDLFPAAGLRSFLRDELGLDYVTGISENASQKYAYDYTIAHAGGTLMLGPHIRHGRNRTLLRIYLHVDDASRTIIVGKVTRHLRDDTA